MRGGHDAGYASLVAIGAVFLATGLALAWAEPFLVRAREERALIAKWERAERLESTAIGLLTDLERETDGDARKMLAYQLPMNATLRDSGSLVALNWVRAFVLLDSPLRDVFKGGSPEELQSFRAREPLPTRLRDYDRFFDPSDSSTYFTIDAPMNINTVDEFAFASAISQMTGDASEGTTWRGKLRSLRLGDRTIDSESDLKAWFGPLWDSVAGFVAVVPEWNANSLDPFLLASVLRCPAFKVPDAPSAAGAILQARKARYLESAELHRLVGAPDDSPLWDHLGTDSTSWSLRIVDEQGLSLSLWFCTRMETESGSAFRLVSRRYEQQ